jgi:hypothetical protein
MTDIIKPNDIIAEAEEAAGRYQQPVQRGEQLLRAVGYRD